MEPGPIKPPKAQRLPDIVTFAEAQRLIGATPVLSYRVFYFTLYSPGLHLGKGLRLQVGDIDAVRGRVHVRDAECNRDRFVPLPKATHAVPRYTQWLNLEPPANEHDGNALLMHSAHRVNGVDNKADGKQMRIPTCQFVVVDIVAPIPVAPAHFRVVGRHVGKVRV